LSRGSDGTINSFRRSVIEDKRLIEIGDYNHQDSFDSSKSEKPLPKLCHRIRDSGVLEFDYRGLKSTAPACHRIRDSHANASVANYIRARWCPCAVKAGGK
jgi:hypothetical protein